MTSPSTTPTGVPIIDCNRCSGRHPATRKHCRTCGRASAFVQRNGLCLACRPDTDIKEHS